jgi:hypothetical protein
MDDVVGATTPPGYAMHVLGGHDEQLYIASAKEPATVVLATREMAWRKAMEEEPRVIEENHTWTLIKLSTG